MNTFLSNATVVSDEETDFPEERQKRSRETEQKPRVETEAAPSPSEMFIPTGEDADSQSCPSVMFDPVVSIFPIPPRSSYSRPEDIWSSFKDIEEMRSRNWLEFAAEGFDWRNVAEEVDMVDGDERRKVHPIHANPLLGSALKKRIAYPRARHWLEEAYDELADAAYQKSQGLQLERPGAPFAGVNDSDDE